MKKIVCLIIALICIVTGFYGCDLINKTPITLADNISIPNDGIITSNIFAELKRENKAAVFSGISDNVHYEWIIFGNDIKEAKDLNLGLEIIEANGEKLIFKFLSNENFGFSPSLSIYLNDSWNAQSATMRSDNEKEQHVTITYKNQSILNFSPEVQIGAFTITPNYEVNNTSSETVTLNTSSPDTSYETSQSSNTISETYESYTDSKNQYAESSKQYSSFKEEEVPIYVTESQKVDSPPSLTCTFSIECSSIFNNLSNLENGKLDILPKNGIILVQQQVVFYEGESVYDVLQRICRENKIHLEASYTPVYNSAYIDGIGNLYELDCGSGSGWMYRVNGWYPNYGCGRYTLQQGDSIEWRYTCNLGKDIGCINLQDE